MAEKIASNSQAVPAGQGKPASAKKRSLQVSANALAMVVSLGVLGFLIFATWQAYQPSVAAGTPVLTSTPALPQLKLNEDHSRKAPEIVVQEEEVGKDNPFAD